MPRRRRRSASSASRRASSGCSASSAHGQACTQDGSSPTRRATAQASCPRGRSPKGSECPFMRGHVPDPRVDRPAPEPGDESLAPYIGPGQAGPMILDSAGGLVWFKALPTNTSATNFQEQQYGGKPVLTWWQGEISVPGFGLGEDV